MGTAVRERGGKGAVKTFEGSREYLILSSLATLLEVAYGQGNTCNTVRGRVWPGEHLQRCQRQSMARGTLSTLLEVEYSLETHTTLSEVEHGQMNTQNILSGSVWPGEHSQHSQRSIISSRTLKTHLQVEYSQGDTCNPRRGQVWPGEHSQHSWRSNIAGETLKTLAKMRR